MIKHLRTLPFLFAGFCYVLWYLFATGVNAGEDLLFHLRAGELVLATGAVPRSDPWSWSIPGHPWTAHEWGWATLAWLAYRTMGYYGVLAVVGLSLLLFVWALQRAAVRLGAPPELAAAVTMAATLLSAPWWVTRPHTASLALWALAWLWLSGGSAPWWRWGLLGVVWANLHGGSAVLLPGLLLAEAAASRLGMAGQADRARARSLTLAAIVSLTATLINPVGVGLWRFTWKLALSPAMAYVRAAVTEFASPDLGHIVFRVLMLTAIGWWIWRESAAVRPTWRERAWYLGLMAAFIMGRRYFPYLAAALVPLSAPALAGVAWTGQTRFPAALTGVRLTLIALAAVLALRHVPANTLFPAGSRAAASHDIALAIAASDRKCLNSYALGNYLIWLGRPVFIDGRGDMYAETDIFPHYNRIAKGELALLEQYGADCVAIGPRTDKHERLIQALQAAGWEQTAAGLWLRKQ